MVICPENDCTRPVRTRGLCGTHYEYRRRRGGFVGVPVEGNDPDSRYAAKVDRSGGPDACHLWTASVNLGGYGIIRVGHRMHLAHRWAYARFVAPLRDDEVVRHTCDNPPCQNLRHLLSGSMKDNVQDMIDRGRSPDRKGERGGRAKLTEDQVLEIRSSAERTTVLAPRYGVSTQLISAIRLRQTWTHV